MTGQAEAVERVRAGETLASVASDYGVSPRTVRRWAERAGEWTRPKATASQATRPVMRDDGVEYATVHDAAWELYLTTDAMGYKGIVSSIIDAANDKTGKRAPYGHVWRWIVEEKSQ